MIQRSPSSIDAVADYPKILDADWSIQILDHFGYDKPLLWLYFLQETDVYVTFTLHSRISLLGHRLVALKTEGPNSWLPVFSVNQSTPVSVLVRPKRNVRISLWRDEESLMHPAYLLRFNGKCQQ